SAEYEEVKALGGLFVLGTERHDARRIDNQLRGRSGRQGDPGETQFFVSLEDSLMRIFATDTIKNMMGKLNIPEDEPIENKLITNALEKAQEKIEGFNFDARKHVLEFDDVLNHQRSVIYKRRRSVLLGGREEVDSYFSEASELLEETLRERFLAKTKELESKPEALETMRRVILQTVDTFWVDHLETMEHLRSSVNLRAYGQRDPLVEYKKEGLSYFKDMEASIARQIAEFFVALDPNVTFNAPSTTTEKAAMALADVRATPISPEEKKVGRNDPCWCGSGKKFKKCHGANS
ncbi:MAG: SEC-C metal-binding domain-containing protein, partial [Patescibacteria group bacterium]